MKRIVTKKAQSHFQSQPQWSMPNVKSTCNTIREMLRSAELLCGELLKAGEIDDYNELAGGLMEIHDDLSNLQYEYYADLDADDPRALRAEHDRDRMMDEKAERMHGGEV